MPHAGWHNFDSNQVNKVLTTGRMRRKNPGIIQFGVITCIINGGMNTIARSCKHIL